MSEQNTKPQKQVLLTSLIIILIAIVGIQLWYMKNMKQQLDAIQYQHETVKSILETDASTPVDIAATSTLPSELQTPVTPQQNDTSLDAQTKVEQQHQGLPVNPAILQDDAYLNPPYYRQNQEPYEVIGRMQRQTDSLFNGNYDPYNSSSNFHRQFQYKISTPEMDVHEDESKYVVLVNLPGVDEKNISINLNGQRLTVKGEQKFSEQKSNAAGNVIFRERHSGRFQRSIMLHEPVQNEGMQTRMNNGVLSITITKLRTATR